MVDENLYLNKDLEDYADFDSVTNSGYGSPTRGELLQQTLNLNERDIRVVSSGGWQGTLVFLFWKHGYVWVIKDSYGSCELCDGLLGHSHPEEYALGMMRNAYCFEDVDDTETFLGQVDGYEWRKVRQECLGRLEDLR